jgi:hypothetical protein
MWTPFFARHGVKLNIVRMLLLGGLRCALVVDGVPVRTVVYYALIWDAAVGRI